MWRANVIWLESPMKQQESTPDGAGNGEPGHSTVAASFKY